VALSTDSTSYRSVRNGVQVFDGQLSVAMLKASASKSTTRGNAPRSNLAISTSYWCRVSRCNYSFFAQLLRWSRYWIRAVRISRSCEVGKDSGKGIVMKYPPRKKSRNFRARSIKDPNLVDCTTPKVATPSVMNLRGDSWRGRQIVTCASMTTFCRMWTTY
jgi:hypothetical protein